MGYRDFTDSDGVQWQAWDVVPQLVERRRTLRRAIRQAPWRAIERRSGIDRRIMSTRRPTLSDGLGHGWLCFESRAEKRRLVPVPADWMRCRAVRLEEYCRQAVPVRRPSEPVTAPDLAPTPASEHIGERRR